MEFFKKILDSDFMPHGHCYFWRPEIVWTNAISDSIIALAYLTIPLSLVYIVKARKDFRYYWLLILFAIFILGCGATHIMDVINIWNPIYRLDSALRVITAIASVGTALMLVKITPNILLIPNGEEFKKVNNDLKQLNNYLEERVLERTKELQENEKKLIQITETLKSREQQLHLITETIPAAIAYMGTNEEFIFTNEFYRKTWPLNLPYNGAKISNLFSKEVYDHLKPVIDKVLQGTTVSNEFEVGNPDGNKVFNVTFVPDLSSENKVRGFVVMGIDMTERISYEKKLEEKNRELIKINNDLDNFIYTASHDLKAPISNMEGLLYSMHEDIKEQKTEDLDLHVELLESSVKRLKTTIGELTHISQIQKNFDSEKELINIEKYWKEVVEDHRLIINECGAGMKEQFEVTAIRYSGRNFRSILYNLLNNALKYKKLNTVPEVNIKTEMINGSCMLLTFSDNGIGFDLQQKEKIFRMFKRLHSHVEGTGVGLYIVKRIIENSGDRIEVESTEGVGTTFRIYINMV